MAKVTINIPTRAVEKVVRVFASDRDDLTLLETEEEKVVFIKSRLVSQIKRLVKEKELEKRYRQAQEEIFNAVDEDIN